MRLIKKSRKNIKRGLAGILAVIITISGLGIPAPLPSQASDIWPQQSTAPFYCLDGGKSWRTTDRYSNYKYDTLPAPISETQAKRLFWAYPTTWQQLKKAAQKYDPALYAQIASTSSGANTVKYVKDDASTKFAWVADNPEIEARAIAAIEQLSSENAVSGKEAPEAIRDATSEENAVAFQVLPFSDGPGALDTEFILGSDFIRDIVKIEPQSVWDNGSGGGTAGWLDASQDKNIAKSVMGENLYEITWSGTSIKIHNNGSATANENALDQTMSPEEKYNKTTVRYKITMRSDAGWYTEGGWNDDYLHEWMDFKACVNAPDHQRLYKADIRIVPSDMVFYLVISQDGEEGDFGMVSPGYGSAMPEVEFRIFRHDETFEAKYNVQMQKFDDETGMPLKGSQFYLYERFEDQSKLADDESDAGLVEDNLSFGLWDGFQVFAEGTTDENGRISYTDTRRYSYSKTYCDGHGVPEWAEASDDDGEDEDEEDGSEDARDGNRAAAEKWLALVQECEAEAENSGTHFHWLIDENATDAVTQVLGSGEGGFGSGSSGADAREAFERSGCKADCEETYEKFISLRFTYTWKEVQARLGYILHGIHADDLPIELVTTNSSEAGADSVFAAGSSSDITEDIWYTGNRGAAERELTVQTESAKNVIINAISKLFMEITLRTESEADLKKTMAETESNALRTETSSNAERNGENISLRLAKSLRMPGLIRLDGDDSDWETRGGSGDFQGYLNAASADGISHLDTGDSGKFSHCNGKEDCGDSWLIYDHRTEGRIHINKRDLDLYRNENGDYSAYGDTEGDSTLEGAIYGLFAAEDILHPDTELSADGNTKNTGIVYRKNDLTAITATDRDGNADFLVYTVKPGLTYDYNAGKIVKREDIDWNGPKNRYENLWVGRPLILGSYYVKELSRSEGFELSVNGISQEITNYGSGFETPAEIISSRGTAVVSIPELNASMEGEDGSGTGYDELPFTVTSSGTSGYELILSGFPEGMEFYRVDSGEEEVTGPHVTGTEEEIVHDENGEIVWQRAESDDSNLMYEPEYGSDGTITGQIPMSRVEEQIIKAEQVPEKKLMELTRLEVDESDMRFSEPVLGLDIADEENEYYRFIKAVTEEILNRNQYEVPATADGVCSQEDAPVYSRGVRKGEPDEYGMTTAAGEPATKTVYGAAITEVVLEEMGADTTVLDVIAEILSWYQENPEWSFGGIDSIENENGRYKVTLYSGASTKDSRRFFTMKEEDGRLAVDAVYSVLENPVALRWVYQRYEAAGTYRYQVDRQYYMGSGSSKRYYIDVTLTPAVLVNASGQTEAIYHTVMVYHKAGEEIVDYLTGDPENGYRVPLTETVDKIEITTETELVEKDVPLTNVIYDRKTETYRITVEMGITDSYGNMLDDGSGSRTLKFMAKLPAKKTVISGAEIGLAEYLLRYAGAYIGVSTSSGDIGDDTYIVTKRLVYRGQERVSEDGDTGKAPLQLLERPIKQKIQVVKDIQDEETIGNFRFKLYLKSNLERFYCDDDGVIFWQDKNGEPIAIDTYRETFPELVQKIYTRETGRRVLETVERDIDGESYHYEKFFDAIRTADTDKWHNTGAVINTSFKPFPSAMFTKLLNEINISEEAKENAKRSDAVRQFAITWYLEEEIKKYMEPIEGKGGLQAEAGSVTYADEIYDKALYEAILKAEDYLKPFFLYDIDTIYEILWDSEENGGIDGDFSTLAANELMRADGGADYAYGISKYLPYGDYVLVEQQPYNPEFLDFPNRHYKIDVPKELSLPTVYEKTAVDEKGIPDGTADYYTYRSADTPNELAGKYLIRFNEEWAGNHEEPLGDYVVLSHSHDGDFEVYPYGLDRDKAAGHYEPYGNPAVAAYYHYASTSEHSSEQNGLPAMTGVLTAYEGRFAPMLIPWSVREAGDTGGFGDSFAGEGLKADYAYRTFRNRLYRILLRIEKLDAETGEQILHDDAVFSLYKAERNEAIDGDGAVKCYEEDTVISGSRQFLEAMGARDITPFARLWIFGGVGERFYGTVPAGTPICSEEDSLIFSDLQGKQTGDFQALSTVLDEEQEGILQTVGYFETPEPVAAGVYVLAETKVPAGYVRSKPIAVEIYSDAVSYYADGKNERVAAVIFPYQEQQDNNRPENWQETARIYVNNTATSLEVSKRKTSNSYWGMKVSGRVEGTISALDAEYGLENLELAYNSTGAYLGFGWKKGTLEYLESRKSAGERVEIVYEKGVFQGYGYVTRTLESAEDENRYVAGATLALVDAIEIRLNGDSEDYAFEGVEVHRDTNGNVKEIVVKQGYAGERTEFVQDKNGVWTTKAIERKDTPVLFYDLGGLLVLSEDSDGVRYGYDRNGKKAKITFDTDSIYALQNGRPVYEISGGDLSELVYDPGAKAFTHVGEGTGIYHLDDDLCRDAMVDGYTGLAYLEKEDGYYYLWPITVTYDENGNVLSRNKILTGRMGEINEGTENAYITGTWNSGSGKFEKELRPVYDGFGMVRYYQISPEVNIKGEIIYDRDGDYIGFQYDDLLEIYNRAAYTIEDHDELFDADIDLNHRYGEAYVIPNVWISGEETPQDRTDDGYTYGRPDLLRRVIPGCYILEELKVPEGYVRAMPVAVSVSEESSIQRVSMTNERTKVEIAKIDGTENYQVPVDSDAVDDRLKWSTEGKGAYKNELISGAKLALFRAKRVYVSDHAECPKGYFLMKAEDTPAVWNIENPVDNHPEQVTAEWITDGKPKYFEGIPAGDYILEELETPKGYLPAKMEITAEETDRLQSFVLKDDHTKLEIFKYEKIGSAKNPLPWSKGATLALYPAIIDSQGLPVTEDGIYRYDENAMIDRWTAKDFSEYMSAFIDEYETLYREYGDGFTEIFWTAASSNASLGGKEEYHAVLEENSITGNSAASVQLWKAYDGSKIRVAATRHGGQPEIDFEYQFNYKENLSETAPTSVSYDLRSGLHRIDRIPTGYYILVEEMAPTGYTKAAPKLIEVKETKNVQRYGLENIRKERTLPTGELVIEKQDSDRMEFKLSGAGFEVVNEETGERRLVVTDESGIARLRNLPIGEWNKDDTIMYYSYSVREVQAPKGYQISHDSRKFSFKETDMEALTYMLVVRDKKTRVSIRKTDMVTGEELPGAKLTLKDRDGNIIDQWISEETPHEIEGELTSGEQYTLIEESAPDGYEIAEEVTFTVSQDGTIQQVVMEDRRADEPEEPTPEEPDEPEPEPEEPEPEPTPTPNKPRPTPSGSRFPEEADKKTGVITAYYESTVKGDAELRLRDTGRIHSDLLNSQKNPEARTRDNSAGIPTTGDETKTDFYLAAMILSAAGILWLLYVRRKQYAMEKSKKDAGD